MNNRNSCKITLTGAFNLMSFKVIFGLIILLLTMQITMPIYAAEKKSDSGAEKMPDKDGDKAHAATFLNDRFPSATQCASCHPVQYRQWSVSQHSYAQMSPVFNAMQGSVGFLTNGTLGDFCIRCHTPVGMNLKEKEFMSNIDRHPTSREGITCIVCHRLAQPYGKLSGRLAIVEGDLTSPIYGPTGENKAIDSAVNKKRLVTQKGKVGRKIHKEATKLGQLTTSGFCGVCHDVTQPTGFRLEEAFSEWKASPASRNKVTCQDCHMGVEPGKIAVPRDHPDFERKNYAFGSAAEIGSFKSPPRKLTNHMFAGPDYSVLPASIFPLNPRAIKEEKDKDNQDADGFATIRQWLTFDIDAGWGTDKFEDKVSEDFKFPPRWTSIDDRYEAREIIRENQALLDEIRLERLKILRVGYRMQDIVVDNADDEITFRVKVANGTNGHGVPTGFDGERLVWLYVRVKDATGKVVFMSGDLDPNGDVRDVHSAYVHNHELPIDDQLFSLQSKFLTTSVRGAEREQIIPVPFSLTTVPFLQPERRSAVLLGRTGGARKHRQGIEPNGYRWAKYNVEKSSLNGEGPYTAHIQLKAAMIPVNLINRIKEVGFDYGLSAKDVADAVVKGQEVLWEREVKLVTGSVTGAEDNNKMAPKKKLAQNQ